MFLAAWAATESPIFSDIFFLSSAISSVGFMAGKSKTSLIFHLLDKNIVKRSTPQPQPPVGGKACSKATQKSSSNTYKNNGD